ncbi:MAG TPA: long-chain-fatty-acid--CoA ligase [Deltaproteobacteria bacterium]|nr:long-chain-fatty-acid--CoA ligase [Deltaproteobacteria bacterium]
MNLAEFRDKKVMSEGERIAIYFKDRELTNLQMQKNSRKLAGALKELGVKRGDRIIIQMPNCPEVLESFYACWRMGAVIVPINFLMNDEEISYIYKDSGAKAVITSMDFLPKVRAAQEKAPDLKTVILIDKDVSEGTIAYHPLVESAKEDDAFADMKEDELAALIYTAGTTGNSKGVMHTHHSLYANAKMQFDSMPFPDGMMNISVLPLCHSFGIATINNGMFRTASTVLLDSFDLELILSSIEKYRGNVMAAVPTMYVYLLLYPEPKKYDVSSMQFWISGSAPLALETWKNFKEIYGGEIIEGWGLTEAGANNSTNPIHGEKKVGSIGVPMKGTEMRIMDDDGKFLPRGEQGEIVIRGPQLMKGYWNKPEETTQAIRDGWLHTGDVGYEDEDGYFWITDRKKDLIIKGGENISPRAIEEALFAHPKISEAAVVGMKDDVYGENIKAFAVLNPGHTATAEEIIEYCKKTLTNFLAPKEVVFMDALPKSLVGKVLKKELRKMA